MTTPWGKLELLQWHVRGGKINSCIRPSPFLMVGLTDWLRGWSLRTSGVGEHDDGTRGSTEEAHSVAQL